MKKVIKRDGGLRHIGNCRECPYSRYAEESDLYENPFYRTSMYSCSKFNLILNNVQKIDDRCKLDDERDFKINTILK